MGFAIQSIVTIVCSILASSGFWALIQKRRDKHDARTKLLIGLAHDRIVYLGLHYIERGYILQSEYENLMEYLWEPYSGAGGNGSAKKVIEEVKKLPIYSTHPPKRKVGDK